MRNLFISTVTLATVFGLVHWMRGLSKVMGQTDFVLLCLLIVGLFLVIAHLIDRSDVRNGRPSGVDQ